jgi:cyclic-di-GMP-binding protein
MPSFDVVSTVNMQEVLNAVDQVKREIGTRFDFKGSETTIELNEAIITIVARDKLKLEAVNQILREKLAKRGISLKSVEFKDPQKAGGDTLREEVHVKQSLTADELKALNKEIKASKMKVSAQIQGDQLRVTGKKRDDLQSTIAHLRSAMADLELQFINFRD